MGKPESHRSLLLSKCPTGIAGLDEITCGGLPRSRPTLVCGGAGSGKTLLAMEFLVRGATEFGEPGVFMSFEETEEELAANIRSLGFDLDRLVAEKRIEVDHVHIERSEIEETGEYGLEGLFIRLGCAIDSVGAKRVVIDTVEALFAGLSDTSVLRGELRRLFRWLKDRKVTAIITGERGAGQFTRHGLEEYVSDCVLLLDHRVTEQVSTRRMRVVKYRGSTHGSNEYPFLIDQHGISVLPITSLHLEHTASSERVSSGVARLDTMLGGGFFRGTTVLVSGTAGTGKTSVAAHFVDAACRRGERCIYFAFEESRSQLCRNMRSVGIDLGPWEANGLLRFHATRPTMHGLEMHLTGMYKACVDFRPAAVVIDPISSFLVDNEQPAARQLAIRLVDMLKAENITALFTSLSRAEAAFEQTTIDISSLIDTWLLLRVLESNGERNRGLYILKSRGMAHSNQIREFLLTDRGIELADVYVGPEGVLAGSSRLAQEARARATALARQQDTDRMQRALERKQTVAEAQIAAIRADLKHEEEEIRNFIGRDKLESDERRQAQRNVAVSRWADE